MRVPIPVVILLALAVVGGVWWTNTRGMDFMTPPTEERLEEVRAKVEASLPRADQLEDAISAPPPPPPPPLPPPVVEEPKPEIPLGDLTSPPTLQQYGELSAQGSAAMIALAAALEEKGHFQRALLAWERVIDLTKPDETQAATAISSIKRLRPTLPDWNDKPEATIEVTLHAGTGKQQAKALKPILEGVARDLEAASSGILKVKPMVAAGKSTTKGAPPVALWLAGPDPKSPSTEVLSFTTESSDTLRQEILKTIFLLVRSHLSQTTAYTPPAALAEGEEPQSALNFRITRLCWSEFAAALSQPAKKAE